MKLSKLVKPLLVKIGVSAFLAIFLFSTSALTEVLTQQKALQAAETASHQKADSSCAYDGNGNVIKTLTTNNQPGQAGSYSKVEYEYNNRNWLTLETHYDGINTYYTSYTYYNDGLLESMTTGNGAATTTYYYDYAGRLIELEDALGKSEHYTYDGNGNLISVTDRNGWETTYTYDGLGRVLTVLVNTGDPATGISQTFTYTLTGELRSDKLPQAQRTLTERRVSALKIALELIEKEQNQ